MATMQRLQQQLVSGRAGPHRSIPFVSSRRVQHRNHQLAVLKAQNGDARSNCQQDQKIGSSTEQPQPASWDAHPAFLTACSLLLLTGPAQAADGLVDNNPFAGIQSNSLYVTLALFLMSVPGGCRVLMVVTEQGNLLDFSTSHVVPGQHKTGCWSCCSGARLLVLITLQASGARSREHPKPTRRGRPLRWTGPSDLMPCP
jgi:hypothetical protein